MHQQPRDVPHKTQSPVLMSPSSLQTPIKALGWEKRLQCVSECLCVARGPGTGVHLGVALLLWDHMEKWSVYLSSKGHTDLYAPRRCLSRPPPHSSVRTGLPEERGVLEADELGVNP